MKKTHELRNDINPRQINYWINKGFSQQESKNKVHQRQITFSLQKCISKYGQHQGTEIWKRRQDKWQNTLNNKSSQQIQRINKDKIINSFRSQVKNKNGTLVSKAQLQLCEILNGDNSFYLDGYVYDIKVGNKILQFNGDYWHCNPATWQPYQYNKSIKMTAKEKWKIDIQKINYAKKKGYNVLVVWECNWKKDKNKVINECKKFIGDMNV